MSVVGVAGGDVSGESLHGPPARAALFRTVDVSACAATMPNGREGMWERGTMRVQGGWLTGRSCVDEGAKGVVRVDAI